MSSLGRARHILKKTAAYFADEPIKVSLYFGSRGRFLLIFNALVNGRLPGMDWNNETSKSRRQNWSF